MVLPTTGAISFSDVVREFGRSDNLRLSDYYRGGARVPDIPANNNIPRSGAIALSNYRGGQGLIRETLTGNRANLDVRSMFQAVHWSSVIPKELVIRSGVSVYSQDPSRPALTIPHGFTGTLKIIIQGGVYGASGTAGGGAGGTAIDANQDFTLIVEAGAQIFAGGGGGGNGGRGANGHGGSYTYAACSHGPRTTDAGSCGCGDRYCAGHCSVGRQCIRGNCRLGYESN